MALWSNIIDFGHGKYYLSWGEIKYTVAAFAAAVTAAMLWALFWPWIRKPSGIEIVDQYKLYPSWKIIEGPISVCSSHKLTSHS